MKTPSLLLLLAVAAPAFAAGAADRCAVDVLKDAAAAAARIAPNTVLSVSSDTLTNGRKDTKEMTFCEGPVWHYLAHLAPVPGGQPTVIWNDPDLQKDWAAGLPEQLKILTAIDDLYKSRVDGLGLEALAAADAVVNDAVASGVVAKKDGNAGGDLSKLALSGFTANAYAMKANYTLSAPASADAPAATDDMKAAFKRLLADAPAKAAPKAVPGAPAAKAPPKGPKEVKPGSAVLAFRKSIIMLANDLAMSASSREIMKGAGVSATVTRDFSLSASAVPGAKAALVSSGGIATIPAGIEAKETAYKAALTFLVGTDSITAADDDSAHESAALSGLDYGLRNLIALRAAAVDQSVAAAKARLNGASVAEMMGPAGKAGPAAKVPPATMASDVMKRLAATKDYSDLNTLYENGGPKNATTGAVDPAWKTSAEGVAVQAQLAAMQKDAAAVTTVTKGQPNAGMLVYSIGGHAVTDQGISVADFKLSPSYRDTIVDAIASNIAAYPMTAAAQAALAAFRGVGQPGTTVTTPLTPAQLDAAKQLPPAKPVVVTAPAPAPGFQQGHHSGLFGLGWTSGPEAAEAAYQKDKSQRTAAQVQTRTDVEGQAEAEAQRVVDSRQAGLQALQDDPNPNPKLQSAALDTYTKATAKLADAQRTAYVATRTDYVPAATTNTAEALQQKQHDDLMDANYSVDIGKSIAALTPLYKADKSNQRSYAEDNSGYKGHWYKDYPIDKGWVDKYFTDNWAGDKAAAQVASCKIALGYKKDGSRGDFKDPSVKNVDERCVRTPLTNSLSAHKKD